MSIRHPPFFTAEKVIDEEVEAFVIFIVTVPAEVRAVVEEDPFTLQLFPVIVRVFVLLPEEDILKVNVAVVPTKLENVGVWADPAPLEDATCNVPLWIEVFPVYVHVLGFPELKSSDSIFTLAAQLVTLPTIRAHSRSKDFKSNLCFIK